MEIDISDILAEVSRPPISSTSQAGQSYGLASSAYTDHQLLVRAWTSERSSPSLMPYPVALINRVTTRISEQIIRIEDMTSSMSYGADPFSAAAAAAAATTSMTTAGKPNHNQNTNLILSILQTDLSRTQFILRSYLRQRLTKITKYAVYWLKHHGKDSTMDGNSNESTSQGRNPVLSPAENAFLRSHQALLSEFYDSSFLASFPTNLRRLDDSAGGVNMVEGPDGGVGVVVRCLAGSWDNVDDLDGDQNDTANDSEQPDVELRMRKDEVWVVRWRDVRQGVVNGDLELL